MIRKILPWFVFVGLILLLVIGFASRDNLSQYLSNSMLKNASPELVDNGAAYIDSAFNYPKNGLSYQTTFLEFGATGCVACRKMESVMDEVKPEYAGQVNVVFLNVLKRENQLLMKYYGIAEIPTQVLLDKNGKEFFRHTGFIEKNDLQIKFQINE